jgi:hypothetical protein
MKIRSLLAVSIALTVSGVLADDSHLLFRPSGPGLYAFDTGAFRGTLKLDGKFQGVYPLSAGATGPDLTRPPGIFSPYRVFSGSVRFGSAARDWPTTTRVLADGAVEARWAAAREHPLAITAVYRWTAPGTLDAEWTVKPERDMQSLELFMSTYFTKDFLASVYMRPTPEEKPRFVPIDRAAQDHGGYVMFPRDKAASEIIHNGRWKVPPNAVDWALREGLAAPLVIRRDKGQGLTAAIMCPRADCFAIASPWNPQTPEGKGYRSIYLSLFGRDAKAGQQSKARCRLVLGPLTDDQVLAEYEKYVRP